MATLADASFGRCVRPRVMLVAEDIVCSSRAPASSTVYIIYIIYINFTQFHLYIMHII